MLDPIDLQIINKLNGNGRISLTELAEDINLSRVAIANRIEKLIQNEFLQVHASLNLEKLHYNTLIVQLQVEKEKIERVKQLVEACPKVLLSLELTGNYNLLIVCVDKNSTGLRNFIEHVLKPHCTDCQVTLSSNPFTPKYIHLKTLDCEKCGHKEDCHNGV